VGVRPGEADLARAEIPHTASGAIALLDAGHALLRADLLGLSENDLNLPRRTNWGEVWPASRIFTVLIDHDALHGGAIGQMRDLYFGAAGRRQV